MAEDHAADQPMPLEITSWGVPESPDQGRPYVQGRFTRHPDFTFEVECVDWPNERTYQNTRLAFLLIKVDGVTVWAWSAPMEEALRAFLADRPNDWQALLYLALLEPDQTWE
jgi:hypothetical protein